MIRKNNKGFTLIEVIAVVALLGILSVMVVPRIFSLVTDSRKNIYVQDAKRLISQARYTMNAKSVKIEKPDNDECIVFSMKYLSVSDFQHPPNGGNYLPEASFVVVKNVGGEYIYSVMIVEKTKDQSYMGVALSTENALNEKGAINLVQTFEAEDVAYIDENASFLNGGDVINSAYINRYIHKGKDEGNGDWVADDDSIIGYYNNDEVEDVPLSDAKAPKVSAKFSGGEGLLNSTLSVSATDADNASSELTVCVKVGRDPNASYPDPKNSSDYSKYCAPYGSEKVYTKEIDFSDSANGSFNYTTRESAYIFILVSDPSNNFTRKRLTYEIHENEKPVIVSYYITTKDGDPEALPTAKITLSIKDDMTATPDLEVCFLQDDPDGSTCTGGYKAYSTLFNSSGNYNYTFKDGNGNNIIEPDGSSHDLKVFVKDSSGLIISKNETYRLYKNKQPYITDYSLTPDNMNLVSTNDNSLTATIHFTIGEDLSADKKINVTFEEIGTSNKKTMTYEEYKNSDRKYTFAGKYDGETRQIKITATDEYGVSSEPVTLSLKGVYSNRPPVFTNFDISHTDNACAGADSCYDPVLNGGTYDVDVTLNIKDDLTKDKDELLVCVSENEDDCVLANKNTKFMPYSQFSNAMSLSHGELADDKLYPNQQITKTLYAAAIDSYGSITIATPATYKIYYNHEPKFDGLFSVNSTTTDGNVAEVQFDFSTFQVVDDFNNYKVAFCYKINNGDEICTNYQTFESLKSSLSSNYVFKDEDGHDIVYDGQKITSFFRVKDNYNLTNVSREAEYILLSDVSPEIRTASIESTTKDYNNTLVNVKFAVNDFHDTYKVCITNTDEDCPAANYQTNEDGKPFSGDKDGADQFIQYTIQYDGVTKSNWDPDYNDVESNKVLYLYVKDSHGNVAKQPLSYEVYKICSNEEHKNLLSDHPTFTRDDEMAGVEINAENCNGACYQNYETTTEDSRNRFDGSNSTAGTYVKHLTFMDTLVNKQCNEETNEELHCDNVRCFDTGNTKNPNVLALKLYDKDFIWTYTNSKYTSDVDAKDPVCTSNDQNAVVYFNKEDPRCTKNQDDKYTFCLNQTETYCQTQVDAELAAAVDINQELDRDREREIAQKEEEKQEIIASRWEQYYADLEEYHAQVAACEAQQAEEYAIYLKEKKDAQDAYVRLKKEEYDTIAAQCEILDGIGDDLQTYKDACSEKLFCEGVQMCENGKNDEPPTTRFEVNSELVYVCDGEQVNTEPEDPEQPAEPEDPEQPAEPTNEVHISYTDAEKEHCDEILALENLNNVCTALSFEESCAELGPWDENAVIATFDYPKFEFDDCTAGEPPEPDFSDLEHYTDVPLPDYVTVDEEAIRATCRPGAIDDCSAFLDSFCEEPPEQKTFVVGCDSSEVNLGPYWCRKKGVVGQYCSLGYDDNTCNPTDPDCVQMCYREVNCDENVVTRANTFVCQGYFKAYQANRVGDYIQLQDTGMKICPDFYRLHPEYFYYDSTAASPFLQFNPSEIFETGGGQ